MADTTPAPARATRRPEILDYVNRVHAPHDAALARAFAVPEGIPAIQVGPSEGKLLHLLLRLVDAKKVVEVGTLVGYSAIHMARALRAGRPAVVDRVRAAATPRSRARTSPRPGSPIASTVLVGAGRDVLPTLAGQAPFDAVFIDADKENYDSLRPVGGRATCAAAAS